MQRAGVLEVLSVNTERDDETSWEVEIRDPALLSERDIGAWDRIFTLRDSQQGTARAELGSFVRLMTSPAEPFLIREVLELTEEKTIQRMKPRGPYTADGVHPPKPTPPHH